MTIFVEKIGQGSPLVMLTGWGLHGKIWMQATDLLSKNYELHLIDLPGIGINKGMTAHGLDTIAAALKPSVPQNAAVLGWSFGGLVAMKIALQQDIKQLILVGSSPCFMRKHDWQNGLSDLTFFDPILQNFESTMCDLLTQLAQNCGNKSVNASDLTTAFLAKPQPEKATLQAHLDILRQTDLRTLVPQIKTPTLLLQGENDLMVPQAAMQWVAQQMPNATLQAIKNAGHELFISHPAQFSQTIHYFLAA